MPRRVAFVWRGRRCHCLGRESLAGQIFALLRPLLSASGWIWLEFCCSVLGVCCVYCEHTTILSICFYTNIYALRIVQAWLGMMQMRRARTLVWPFPWRDSKRWPILTSPWSTENSQRMVLPSLTPKWWVNSCKLYDYMVNILNGPIHIPGASFLSDQESHWSLWRRALGHHHERWSFAHGSWLPRAAGGSRLRRGQELQVVGQDGAGGWTARVPCGHPHGWGACGRF